MDSGTLRKANLFLFMNLLCYVLACIVATTTTTTTTVACSNCSSPSALGLTPSRGGNEFNGSKSSSSNTSQPTACPRDALKLGVCANLLGELVGLVIGNPQTTPCCTLLVGLVDLEAAICLCTAIKANVVGINLNIPVTINVLMNVCGKTLPQEFICA